MDFLKTFGSLAFVLGYVITVLVGSPPALQASDRPPGVISDQKQGTKLVGFCFLEYTNFNEETKKALAANMALRLESEKKGFPLLLWASNVPGTADCGDGSFNCQDTANLPASVQSVLDALSPQILNSFGFPNTAVIGVSDLTKITPSTVDVYDTVIDARGPTPQTVKSRSRVVMCDVTLIVS